MPGNQTGQDAAAQLVAEMLRLLEAWKRPADGSGPSEGYAPAAQFLQQAWLASLASTLRSWARMLEASANALPLTARTLTALAETAPSDPAGRGALIDELRARLRALTEIPAEEARRLQAEVDALIVALASAPDASPGEPFRRRWSPKP